MLERPSPGVESLLQLGLYHRQGADCLHTHVPKSLAHGLLFLLWGLPLFRLWTESLRFFKLLV